MAAVPLSRIMASGLRTTAHARRQGHDLSAAGPGAGGCDDLPPASAGGVARAACRVISGRPGWERSILSAVPGLDLSDPELVRLVLVNLPTSHLSYRFFLWMSSRRSYSPHPLWLNALCVALARDKQWEAARHVLYSTKCQCEVKSLKFYVKSLCKEGMVAEAMDTMAELRKSGADLGVDVWNKLLCGALSVKRTDLVWKVYGEMMEIGVGSDSVTAGHLIGAFARENKLGEAYELLREVVDNGSVPGVSAFTTMISEFCRKRNYGKVSELLHMMIAKNCYPDIFTYQSIIHGLCDNNMTLEGFRVFQELGERGYVFDVVIYTTMIHGLCKVGRMDAAVELWQEMRLKRIVPNTYTYNVMIDGYCKAGNLEAAEKLYKEMCSTGHVESTVSCNTLIAGYCLQGRLKEASNYFEKMKANGIPRDTITYNALIEGFCKYGRVSDALDLLNELLQTGLQPNPLSYIFLIKSLCQEGNVEKAIEFQNEMLKRGLGPLKCSYDYIICAFCNLEKLSDAIDWLSHTIDRHIKPKKETFELLIQLLIMKDRVDDALLILGCMSKLGLQLQESVSCLLVSRLCEGNSDRERESLEAILKTELIC